MLLHHIPTRRVVSGSNIVVSSTMDPPDQKELTLISASMNPMDVTSALKMARMMARIATVISSLCI